MKEKPILFSSPMIRAILDGKKSMTRRVIKPQPPSASSLEDYKAEFSVAGHDYKCTYGQVGTAVWVKEAHYLYGYWEKNGLTKTGKQRWRFNYEWLQGVKYPDNPPQRICREKNQRGWFKRSSLFMPRWASRITLEITGIRVQRVQEISEEDAIAEGCEAEQPKIWWQGYREWELGDGRRELMHQQAIGDKPPDWMIEPHRMQDRPDLLWSAKRGFSILWDSINRKRKIDYGTNLKTVYPYSWIANPWCWCISFKRIDS